MHAYHKGVVKQSMIHPHDGKCATIHKNILDLSSFQWEGVNNILLGIHKVKRNMVQSPFTYQPEKLSVRNSIA